MVWSVSLAMNASLFIASLAAALASAYMRLQFFPLDGQLLHGFALNILAMLDH